MIVSICIYIYTLVIITYHILLWSHVWLLHISTFLLPEISKSNIIITNCFTPHVCCSCWLNHHLSSELSQLNHQLCWLNHHVSWLIYDDYINYIRNVRFHPTSLKILKAPRKWWSGSILDDREKKHGNWCKYLYVNQQRWWLNQQSWWFNWESSDDKWWFNQQKTRNMVIWTNNHGEWNNKQLLVLPNIGVYSTSFLSTLAKWFWSIGLWPTTGSETTDMDLVIKVMGLANNTYGLWVLQW